MSRRQVGHDPRLNTFQTGRNQTVFEVRAYKATLRLVEGLIQEEVRPTALARQEPITTVDGITNWRKLQPFRGGAAPFGYGYVLSLIHI